VTLHRDSHIFSVASSFVPFEGLSLSVASQNEFTRQDGFGDIGLDAGNPTIPGLFFTVPATVNSDLDETKTSQTVALRFTKIPYTVLFADGQFAQDGIAHFEEEVGATSPDAFTLDTDYNNRLQDLRAGFDTSPWQWGSWSAHYRYRDSDSDYDHPIDTAPGYPGFIRHRKIQTDEAETRLTLRPVYWFKASLGYQWTSSEYSTATDPLLGVPFFGDISPGGGILAGRYRANIYSVSATWIPAQRFYFTGLFSYSDSRTETWAQQNGGPVVPYAGDIYSVMASANYALNSRTALKASYAFSRGAFGQNNAGGLPLGLDYTQHGLAAGISREWSSRVSTSLRYQFYQYHEPSTGSLNDFTAHGVFATVTLKWP
jgi:hypothetical protein